MTTTKIAALNSRIHLAIKRFLNGNNQTILDEYFSENIDFVTKDSAGTIHFIKIVFPADGDYSFYTSLFDVCNNPRELLEKESIKWSIVNTEKIDTSTNSTVKMVFDAVSFAVIAEDQLSLRYHHDVLGVVK